MRIDIIDTDAGFDAIRENWDSVFMEDPYAQHFLSWVWLKTYMGRRRRWFILALRERAEGSPYVAFFPLRVVTQQDKKTGRFIDEIIMAGILRLITPASSPCRIMKTMPLRASALSSSNRTGRI